MIETIKKKYYFQSVRPQQLGEKSKEIFGVNRQLAQFKTIVCKNGKTEFLTSIYTDDNWATSALLHSRQTQIILTCFYHHLKLERIKVVIKVRTQFGIPNHTLVSQHNC